MRHELMAQYGMPLIQLQEKIKQGGNKDCEDPQLKQLHRMYCGITRFLVEDAMFPGQKRSRTSVQKTSRVRAYEVIRRSNAWSDLIENLYPDAIRLSIHPQVCGAKKLGIKLMSSESWMTPWHGVTLDTKEGYILVKRAQAEALGARLIYSAQGRPSHYELDREINYWRTLI